MKYSHVMNLMLDDIREGIFPVEKRIPGCRQLAIKYGVSIQTARSAMAQLEKHGVLQRMGQKGTFIIPGTVRSGIKKQMAFIYSFSPIEILGQERGFESWAITTEIIRGMVAEAQARDVVLCFEHLESSDNSLIISRQANQLDKYCHVIFIGETFAELKKVLRARKQSFCSIVDSWKLKKICDGSMIGCPYELSYPLVANYIREAGYRSVNIVRYGLGYIPKDPKSREAKINTLTRELENRGITDIACFDPANEKECEILLEASKGKLIFANNTYLIPLLYQTAFQIGLVPGKDFDLLGFASGLTFSNIYPRVSYFQPCYFEYGCSSIRYGLKIACDDLEFRPVYIHGATTR